MIRHSRLVCLAVAKCCKKVNKKIRSMTSYPSESYELILSPSEPLAVMKQYFFFFQFNILCHKSIPLPHYSILIFNSRLKLCSLPKWQVTTHSINLSRFFAKDLHVLLLYSTECAVSAQAFSFHRISIMEFFASTKMHYQVFHFHK